MGTIRRRPPATFQTRSVAISSTAVLVRQRSANRLRQVMVVPEPAGELAGELLPQLGDAAVEVGVLLVAENLGDASGGVPRPSPRRPGVTTY